MLQNLAAASYRPDQVDEVYFTHIHPDHVGGLLTPAGAAFPNATLRMDGRELAYWTDAAQESKAAEGHRPFFSFARTALEPYKATGRIKTFDGETELTPGIRAAPEVGHTHGHTVYNIESDGQQMLVWGDVMHVGEIQFAQPQVTIVFDTDSPTARTTRKRIFDQAPEEQPA